MRSLFVFMLFGLAFSLETNKDANAFERGFSYVDELAQKEEELLANGQYLRSDSPFFKMAQFKNPTAEVRQLGLKARQQLEAAKHLQAQLGLTKAETVEKLRQLSAEFTVINDTCLATPTCSSSKYRTIDGSCNSLATPNLGRSSTVYRRLATPDYADGIELPRAMANGSFLPNARYLSANMFITNDKPLSSITLAVMQFGQFINHDFQQSTTFSFSNGSSISCCTSEWQMLDASALHPACLPIEIALDDKFMNANGRNVTCMNFVRSVAGPRLDCSLGYADQINQNSHWLDASTVYGSSDSVSASLREYSGGRLSTSTDTANKRKLLPVSSSCTTGSCFSAGDSRVTEQPGLTVMHTVWMREHNRIASALSALNPSWSDEAVFQEARRIVIAEIQHITYSEFLPAILASSTITKYDLAPLSSGFFTGYSAASSGPVSNEFATAAFRMGHSLVQGTVLLYDESGNQLSSSFNMSDWFNDASKVLSDSTFIDSSIRGLLTQPSQSVDRIVANDMWNFLFKEKTRKTGFDIVALNIQRGRDHGLPGYNSYRELCGLHKFTDFTDLNKGAGTSSGTFQKIAAQLLQTYYSSVDDIDLFAGGVMEVGSTAGGIVGETFACLIAEHFKQLKYSDRFFYELGNQAHSFSTDQLAEIRKAMTGRY